MQYLVTTLKAEGVTRRRKILDDRIASVSEHTMYAPKLNGLPLTYCKRDGKIRLLSFYHDVTMARYYILGTKPMQFELGKPQKKYSLPRALPMNSFEGVFNTTMTYLVV
jgi:hypothetical protein